jgi:predicted RNase H-like HicB family nuclease
MPDRHTSSYTVVVPSLPGCNSQGNTVNEALNNARIAIAAHFANTASTQPAEGSPHDELRVAIV